MPCNINTIYTSLKSTLHLVGYNSVADNMGLPSFVLLLLPPKHDMNSKRIWPYSSSRSSKVIDLGVNGKPMWLPSSHYVTLAISATVFEIFTLKERKLLILPTPPLFDVPTWGDPLEFLDETYPAKTRGMGLLYGGNFNRFSMIHPSNGGTGGQTDGHRQTGDSI